MALKSSHISDAYSQLRISGITVDPTAALNSKALQRMEDMLHSYALDIGYNFETNPLLTTDSGVDPAHNLMIASNLAVALVPDFNKQVPQVLLMRANGTYHSSCSKVAAANIAQIQAPQRMPIGSGNRRTYPYQRFSLATTVYQELNTLYVGDINDYTEDYTGYLNGETIASFTASVDSTTILTLGATSNTDTVITYRITGAASGTSFVKLIMTTSAGRITTREIYFEVIAP